MTKEITICLWFDNQAEEAAGFYTTVFKDSKITGSSCYGKEGFEIHGQKEGTVMTISFDIKRQSFTALNGGPLLNLMNQYLFRYFAKIRKKLIITGIS